MVLIVNCYLVLTNQKLEDKVKADFLHITLKYAAYQNKSALPKDRDDLCSLENGRCHRIETQQPRAIKSSKLGGK